MNDPGVIVIKCTEVCMDFKLFKRLHVIEKRLRVKVTCVELAEDIF